MSYWLGLGLSCIIALGLSFIIALGLSCIIALGLSCIIALGLGLAPGCVHAARPMPRPIAPSASNPDSFRGDRDISSSGFRLGTPEGSGPPVTWE